MFNMRRHGWVEGDTVAIVYCWAEGRTDRFAEIAAELVGLKVDVIVTAGTLATLAAKQATAEIPIVFGAVTDAIGSGIVASLSHPGANVTGLTMHQNDTASKRIELLTAPTSMALSCRWRSRPQHQNRKWPLVKDRSSYLDGGGLVQCS